MLSHKCCVKVPIRSGNLLTGIARGCTTTNSHLLISPKSTKSNIRKQERIIHLFISRESCWWKERCILFTYIILHCRGWRIFHIHVRRAACERLFLPFLAPFVSHDSISCTCAALIADCSHESILIKSIFLVASKELEKQKRNQESR